MSNSLEYDGVLLEPAAHTQKLMITNPIMVRVSREQFSEIGLQLGLIIYGSAANFEWIGNYFGAPVFATLIDTDQETGTGMLFEHFFLFREDDKDKAALFKLTYVGAP